MAATITKATEADLLAQPRDGRKYELVDGEIRVSPAGMLHEHVGMNLIALLMPVVRGNGIGALLGSSMGYRLPGGNIRSPDVSVIVKGRYSGQHPGFFEGAPDLAVEIVSPSERRRATLDKVGEYLDCGTRIVWVIDPSDRTATIFDGPSVITIGAGQELDGGAVVPGFRCRLAHVFD